MAQVKDLIVTGPARFLSDTTGLISSASTVPVTNSNAQLAYNQQSTIASIGGQNITVRMPGGGTPTIALSPTTARTYVIGCLTGSTNDFLSGSKYNSGIYWEGADLYATSDERIKDVIGPIDADLDEIKMIPKVFFKWKDSEMGTNEQVGTLAQKVAEVFPQVVTVDENGFYGVSYEKLSVIALAAIDKLHEENLEIKKKNAELEARIERLEKLL